MQYLPAIVGVGSALPALREGRPIEAALQGGLGYLTGSALKGPAKGILMAGTRNLPAGLTKLAPGIAEKFTPAALRNIAYGTTALGLGTGAFLLGGAQGRAASGVPTNAAFGAVGAGGQNMAQLGAGVIGYTSTGEPVYGGQAVPPGMGSYGPTSPTGDPLSVLGPEGMGRRLEQLKSAETQRDAMRLLLPEIYKASEARSKSEFERQMAAAGIRQNIATRAAMLQAAQAAGLGMGQTAAAQAGGALTSQYQYQ